MIIIIYKYKKYEPNDYKCDFNIIDLIIKTLVFKI